MDELTSLLKLRNSVSPGMIWKQHQVCTATLGERPLRLRSVTESIIAGKTSYSKISNSEVPSSKSGIHIAKTLFLFIQWTSRIERRHAMVERRSRGSYSHV